MKPKLLLLDKPGWLVFYYVFFHTLIILQIIDIYVKMHYDGFGLAFESLENHVKETKKVRLKMGEASTVDLT